jgi:tetratricopeptide (TPR) repeat protein
MWTRLLVGGIALGVVFAVVPAQAKNPSKKQAEEEMEFGFKAAKRGYWQEALERFEMADELTPNQPRILNNIAVALEANGRFDEARTTYRAGLALDPSSSALRKNLERFEEFYLTFVAADDEEGEDKTDPDEAAEGETGGKESGLEE